MGWSFVRVLRSFSRLPFCCVGDWFSVRRGLSCCGVPSSGQPFLLLFFVPTIGFPVFFRLGTFRSVAHPNGPPTIGFRFLQPRCSSDPAALGCLSDLVASFAGRTNSPASPFCVGVEDGFFGEWLSLFSPGSPLRFWYLQVFFCCLPAVFRGNCTWRTSHSPNLPHFGP